MSLHNIIGSEAYIHAPGRDVWAGMLRFVRSRRRRVIRLAWAIIPSAIGVSALLVLLLVGAGL